MKKLPGCEVKRNRSPIALFFPTPSTPPLTISTHPFSPEPPRSWTLEWGFMHATYFITCRKMPPAVISCKRNWEGIDLNVFAPSLWASSRGQTFTVSLLFSFAFAGSSWHERKAVNHLTFDYWWVISIQSHHHPRLHCGNEAVLCSTSSREGVTASVDLVGS